MGNNFFRLKQMISLVAAIFTLSASAHFEFSPITMALETTGKTNHAIAQVINRENFAIPITIRITNRKLLENGEEERSDSEDIAVFPTQFLLAPKESRAIKIIWQGEETLQAEKAYRIIVEEVPVEFSSKTANAGAVRILINYVGSIYVNSSKTESNLVLDNVTSEEGKFLSFLFNNKGSSHVIIKSPNIELIAKKPGGKSAKKIILDKTILNSAEGKNVLALSKLKVKIPLPSGLEGYSEFEWKLNYEK